MFKRLAASIQETPVTWGLFAIHFVLFSLMITQEPVITRETLRAFGGQFNPDIWAGESYRLLLAGLLHGSLLHVLMNNISLYVLGRLLEQLLGSAAFLLLYVLSLLAGNIASLHFIPPTVVSIGASGAIMGLAGALFVLLLLDRRGRFLVTRPSGRYLFFGFVAFYLLFGEFVPIINNAAHVGGFVMGGVFGLFFWSRIPGESLPRWIGSVALLAAIAGMGTMAARGIQPKGTYAWKFYHGLEAFQKGNKSDAERYLQEALAHRPTPQVHYYLGQLYFQTRAYPKAAPHFASLLKKQPEHLEHWYYWVTSLRRSQQPKAAQAAFQQAMQQLKKTSASGSWFRSQRKAEQRRDLHRAQLYAANRQEKEALLLYQKLLSQSPENPALHNEVAWLLVTAHDPNYRNPTLALKHARMATARTTEPNAGYLDTLATALAANGKIKAAIATQQRALLAPGAKEVMPHLHTQLRRFEQSLQQASPTPQRPQTDPGKAAAPTTRPSTQRRTPGTPPRRTPSTQPTPTRTPALR